jgi:hypothetical protein
VTRPASRPAPLRGVIARWDAVVIRWALDGCERTALLGGGAEGSVTDVATYRLPTAERRMRLVVELELILERVFADEERTRTWLRQPNRNLGGRTPIEVMAQSPEWIRWLIDAVGIAA